MLWPNNILLYTNRIKILFGLFKIFLITVPKIFNQLVIAWDFHLAFFTPLSANRAYTIASRQCYWNIQYNCIEEWYKGMLFLQNCSQMQWRACTKRCTGYTFLTCDVRTLSSSWPRRCRTYNRYWMTWSILLYSSVYGYSWIKERSCSMTMYYRNRTRYTVPFLKLFKNKLLASPHVRWSDIGYHFLWSSWANKQTNPRRKLCKRKRTITIRYHGSHLFSF